MNNSIATSAEAAENAVLPQLKEIHLDQAGGAEGHLPPALVESPARKSPAQWAYERVIHYIQSFEKSLDNEYEVGLGLAGGSAGTIKIEGLGYFDPDILTYYGTDQSGAKTQLVQHVGQLNVTLVARPKHVDQPKPHRIGFVLAKALERDETDEGDTA